MFDVFTTINPNGDFITQSKAISSWSSKYKTYSINTKNDIDKISELYKDVTFIETNNIFIYNNKELVKLDAILDAIKHYTNNNSIIVNSDIILKDNILIDEDYLENSIIIGSRYEIDGDKPIYKFDNGYDIFIFNKKHVDIFYNENYVIGMPWWDYWMPLIADKSLLSVYHINTPTIYHITHETNYDSNIWMKFGEHLYTDIMIKMLRNPMNISVYDFCLSIKAYIEKKQINI